MSKQSKREAVESYLAKHPNAPVREVAKKAKVSEAYVYALRKRRAPKKQPAPNGDSVLTAAAKLLAASGRDVSKAREALGVVAQVAQVMGV